MNIETLREFFGWMTLINLGGYIWTAAASVAFKSWFGRISGSLFGVEEDVGRKIIYGYVGAYKLLFIVFNLVPWLALTIMSAG